mgnify:CR=1 FL=1
MLSNFIQLVPMRRGSRWLALPPLLVLAALGACSKQAPAPEPVRSVRTQLITAETAGSTREYAGEVKARTESRLGFRVGGKLVSRPVNLGDSVKAGSVLATLDGQDLRLGQEAARAAMTSAQVNFDQVQADFKRYKDLREQGFISAAELERRETSMKVAGAQLAQTRAQSDVQANQANYARLAADVNGVVTAIEAEPGQVLAAGTPVLRLAQDGPRDVVFSVPEDQEAQVRALLHRQGAIKVRLSGGSNLELATVRELSVAADPITRTFLAKADVGKAEVKLGQTAAVLVEAPRSIGAIKVPLAAVFEMAGKSTVWVLDPTTLKVRAQTVTVQGADGNLMVVSSGLAAGQELVTAGVHVLQPGLQVKRATTVALTTGSMAKP